MVAPSDYMCAYGNMRSEIKDWISQNFCPGTKDLKEFLERWEIAERDGDD